MVGVLHNEPLTPVNSWEDLKAILSATKMPGQQQHSQIRELELWTEVDAVLVWAPLLKYNHPAGEWKAYVLRSLQGHAKNSEPLGLCTVDDGRYGPKFGDGQGISLALRLKATVRDLRQALEDTTGKSTAAYAIKGTGTAKFNDADLVFQDWVIYHKRSRGFPCSRLLITHNDSEPKNVVVKVLYTPRHSIGGRGDRELFFKTSTRNRVDKLRCAIATLIGPGADLLLRFQGSRMDDCKISAE